MRIALLKPDYGIIGGFERVLERVHEHLASQGHDVQWRTVEERYLERRLRGRPVPDRVYDTHPEFFRYLAFFEQFATIDASQADLVISTQPPSFAVDHPRHLSLFYHHCRIFYDLADVFVANGFPHPDLHREAIEVVRSIDREPMDRVGLYLAGSPTVRRRLERFNGLAANVRDFAAGSAFGGGSLPVPDPVGPRVPLCVSRHEFPKRNELFVHAMALLEWPPSLCIGIGGRLAHTLTIAHELATGDPATVDSRSLWIGPLRSIPARLDREVNGLRFVGRVGHDDLARAYERALCVVAPALDEDYGLTAVEAMQYGRPVIVCNDGGGLADIVEDGVSGFIVEPTGAGIAQAVRRLIDDPDLALTMGMAARERAKQYTWDVGLGQLDEAISELTT